MRPGPAASNRSYSRRNETSVPTECIFYFLIGLVLAQRIDGPDCRRNPTDDRQLQKQADNAGKWATDGKELKPRQQ